MITREELRIGNYLQDDEKEIKKVSQIAQSLYLNGSSWNTSRSALFPIPLTEQWLEDFGFEKIDNVWFRKNHIQVSKFGRVEILGTIIKSDIKYVHSLQNLCFALTGIELELKIKQPV